jgi:hypothetical protein
MVKVEAPGVADQVMVELLVLEQQAKEIMVVLVPGLVIMAQGVVAVQVQ